MVEIALVGGRGDWHAGRLAAAFTAAGAHCRRFALDRAGFDLTAEPTAGLHLPGFADRLPDAVLVRNIGGGSFEQVTMRLGVLHALAGLGVVVSNPPTAIERCVDKSATSFLLGRAGLPTPPTWACQSLAEAAAIVARETAAGAKVVLKPLFGARGIGLRLLSAADELPPAADVAGAFYLQRFVPPADGVWRDWRVFVVGGQAVAAMMRVGTGWITNVHQGAACESAEAGGDLGTLSVAAARAVGATYAGVDIIRDGDGRCHVLEVNSMPAWSGLQSVTRIDIAATLAADLLARTRATAGPFGVGLRHRDGA
jgi:RimK family alpha-L-glutamate ligase